MSWNDFIKAVADANFEFSWQRPLIVAQAILESGRGTTDLSHYKNMNGMKYRESIAIEGSEKFKYYTDSERDDPNHPGWDWFFKFDTYETGIKVWQKLFFRKDGNWIPYPKVYERDPEVLKDARSFLNYIGPIYCPFFENSHNESYADYILNRCFPEAERLLKEAGSGGGTSRTFKIAIMPGHGGDDSGAYNEGLNAKESEYNWREAEEIKRLLEQDGIYQVIICRDKSEDPELGEFQGRANATGADICLCLHHNSNDKKEAKGWWLFSSKQDSDTGKFLKILDKHFRGLPLQARGFTYAIPPFEGDSKWLKRVWNCIGACKMPTVLFESCFISNDQDCQWLMNEGYNQVAQKICDGVREYLQGAVETYAAVVNDQNPPLNVRSGSGTEYAMVKQLANGTPVTVVDDNGKGWLRISKPIDGWAAKHLIKKVTTTALYRVTVDDPQPPLNVRSGAGTTYSVIGQLQNETILEVEENNGQGWLRISEPIAGWVSESRTRRETPTRNSLYTAVVSDSEPPLNVRTGAGTTFPVIGKLNDGASVEVVEDNQEGWIRISSPLEGWVAKRYVKRQGSGKERLLHLVRTNESDPYGCKWLTLSIHEGDFSNSIETIKVVSGVPSRQDFETGGSHNVPGSLKPLPQGDYSVQPRIDWAGGKGNYNASFGPGLGPVWIPITPKFQTPRGAFGFHLDPNRINSPGTAGCIGFTTVADLKRFVSWFDDSDTAPKSLTVNWGL